MAIDSTTKKSLAFVQLRIQLFKEVRAFWYINNSIHYAEKWLRDKTEGNLDVRLGMLDGGNDHPYSNLNISFREYLRTKDDILEFSRQNAIINLVTAFEEYLSVAYQRAIYLSETTLDKSEMKINIKDVVEIASSPCPKVEFARYVASKKMRNIPIREMIDTVAKVSVSGVMNEKKNDIESLVRYSYVRNAIVHNVRCVTSDLSKQWKDRFSSENSLIETESGDVVSIASLGLSIASAIDKRYVQKIVKDEDKDLLVRELFARFGMEEPKIRLIVNATLGGKFTRDRINSIIAKQKRLDSPPIEFIFSEDVMQYLKLKNKL